MIGLLQKIGKETACFLIRCYQSTRFLRRPSCRFYPSCSEYTHKSIQQHGLIKGILAGVSRIARCHPWNPGGVDEVPETVSLNETFKFKKPER